MRYITSSLLPLIVLFALITACQEAKRAPFGLNAFPKHWVRLTKKDGKLLVYNTCDAGNLLLTISKKNGRFGLLLHGQQEDADFEIVDATQADDTIFLQTKWKGANQAQSFKFFWTDRKNGLGRFVTTYPTGLVSDELFVIRNKQINFEKVDQPCRECWGEECDEIETLTDRKQAPIGVINTIFNNYVNAEESTDSAEDRALMAKNLQSLEKVENQEDLLLLIDVWMYYDPTDFPGRNLVYEVLRKNAPFSREAVRTRMKKRNEWESETSAPYSELPDLLEKLEKE